MWFTYLYCIGGGAIKEVCQGVGEEFHNIETLLLKLDLIKTNYNNYVSKINYNYLSSIRCCEEYLKIINNII